MTIEMLKEQLVKSIGASISETNIVFKIYITKLGEILKEGGAVKIEGVGSFYKEKSVSDDKTASIIFMPNPKELITGARNIFLRINLPAYTDPFTFDPSVFSPGFYQPIVTKNDTADKNTKSDESSHLLKRTIEDRVIEVVSASQISEDFRFDKNYMELYGDEFDSAEKQQKNLPEIDDKIEILNTKLKEYFDTSDETENKKNIIEENELIRNVYIEWPDEKKDTEL